MQVPKALVLAAVAACAVQTAGCEGELSYAGYRMADHFPLDGTERAWKYASDSGEPSWSLYVEKTQESARDGAAVITLQHSDYDTGDLLYEVLWSSDSMDGVQVWGYSDIVAGTDVTFDPPVLMADYQMIPGDTVTTETGGFTFTSTFDGVEGCGTYWVPGWEDETCLRMVVEDGDDDPSTNGIFTGTFWWVPRYGTALFEVDAYEGILWNLSDHDWEA